MRSKLLFLILFAGLLCLAGPARAETLIYNASFEIDEDPADGWPDLWGTWGSTPSWWGDSVEELVMNDPEGAHTGSAYFTGYAGANDYSCAVPYGDVIGGTRAGPLMEPQDTYYVGAWVRDLMPDGQPSVQPPGFEVGFYDADGDRLCDATQGCYTGGPEGRFFFYVDIPADGEYHYIEGRSIPHPPGYPYLNVVPWVSNWTGSGASHYAFDDIWMNSNPQAGLVHSFDPADREESVSPSTTILSWQKEAKCPGKNIKSEVWWGKQDDPNFWYLPGEAIKIMELADVNFVDLSDPCLLGGPITLVSDSVYYWKVMYEEPNACNWGAPLNESPTLSFDTINRGPVVDTGLNVDRWMASGDGPVTIGIYASYVDDGLPEGGVVTHSWNTVSGVDYSPHQFCQDPNITISTPGDYTLELTVDDGFGHAESKTGSDTITFRVFSNSDGRLRAYYPLNSDASDPCGGHNGTLLGSPVFNPVGGQVEGAAELDGGDDYISIGDSGSDPNFESDTWDNAIVDSITVSAWMKLDGDGWNDGWEAIVTKGSASWELQRAGSGENVQFNFRGNDGSVPWSQGGTAAASGSNHPVNDGEWHHVIGVFDRNRVIIYVDGLEAGAAVTDIKKIAKAPGGITIGTTTQVGSDGDKTPWNEDRSTWVTDSFTFGGSLDQVRIYDAAVPYRAEHSNTPGIVELFREDGGHDSCGGVYIAGDEDEDCYVSLADFAIAAKNWLDCNNIADADCD